MTIIKRLGQNDLCKKLGSDQSLDNFILKPLTSTPQRYFEPHRSEMYSLGLIVKGRAEINVDLDKYQVSAPGIITISPEQVIQWITNRKTNKVESIIVLFTEEFALSGLMDTFFIKKLSYYKRNGIPYIPLSGVNFTSIRNILDQIELKNGEQTQNSQLIISSLLRVLLLETENIYQQSNNKLFTNDTQAFRITEKFKNLLSEKFREERKVEYYAKELFISPKHLSQMIKDQTGRTAIELIHEIVCLEAKVLLQNKEMTISEISYQLNFVDPSFFSKFFKRNTGMVPRQYRETLI